MKKFYFAGAALLAVAAVIPATAWGAAKTTFNASNVLVPSSHYTPSEVYTADTWVVKTGLRYEGAQNAENENYNRVWGVPANDANGNEWYAVDYSLTDGYAIPESTLTDPIAWQVDVESPFPTDKWIEVDIMGDFYMRRVFELNELPGGDVFLACGHDDAPAEWYINGVLVHSVSDGWNESETVLLTAEQKALLKKGENLFAVHVHQNWGGAYADCGLYEADQQVDFLSSVADGWWPAFYKTLGGNGDIETAVENGCFSTTEDESTWTIAKGPFSNGNDRFRTTYWNSNSSPILVRRHFNLSEGNAAALKAAGDVYLSISYDEWPVVYLNGTEIWRFNDENRNAWNDDNYEVIQLTDAHKALLKGGDNVVGVSLQSGDGGGHIDFALYTTLPIQGFVVEEGADVAFLKSLINTLIEQSADLEQTAGLLAAVENGRELAASSTATSEELRGALDTLMTAVNGLKNAAGTIKAFKEITEKFFTDEEAQAKFDSAVTADDYNNALKTLRFARRSSLRETHADVFPGQAPAEGMFYLYNVGRKQFLCGGSDWGAHAALGVPGVEIELIAVGESPVYEGLQAYVVRTGLPNGFDGEGVSKEYLGYRGYMDSDFGAGAGGWVFIPVDGKEGVYNMAQSDYENAYVMWNPFGSTDAGNNDENNVCTESHNIDLADANAQWKLVTRAERDALLAAATVDNPADATYFIQSPNFNQREEANSVWGFQDFAIFGNYGGDNRNSFVVESWNSESGADFSQGVEGLPQGVYALTVQGFYRNGWRFGEEYSHEGELEWRDGQPDLEQISNAVIYSDEEEVYLPNIMSVTGVAPGECETVWNADKTESWDIVTTADHADAWFRLGYFKTTVVAEYNDTDYPMMIGVYKYDKGSWGDWIVVDNFRLTYYGNDTTKEEVENGVEDILNDNIDRPADNRIFNLQGIEVKNTTVPGIYIQNGKKFIVK